MLTGGPSVEPARAGLSAAGWLDYLSDRPLAGPWRGPRQAGFTPLVESPRAPPGPRAPAQPPGDGLQRPACCSSRHSSSDALSRSRYSPTTPRRCARALSKRCRAVWIASDHSRFEPVPSQLRTNISQREENRFRREARQYNAMIQKCFALRRNVLCTEF